ncbi:hypothetical protein BC835DRAFT_1415090 [Cytidiella melzeri]|nr:hypothetical protein BC835DRAFT_1415090 [Cytidiella melzeri]
MENIKTQRKVHRAINSAAPERSWVLGGFDSFPDTMARYHRPWAVGWPPERYIKAVDNGRIILSNNPLFRKTQPTFTQTTLTPSYFFEMQFKAVVFLVAALFATVAFAAPVPEANALLE